MPAPAYHLSDPWPQRNIRECGIAKMQQQRVVTVPACLSSSLPLAKKITLLVGAILATALLVLGACSKSRSCFLRGKIALFASATVVLLATALFTRKISHSTKCKESYHAEGIQIGEDTLLFQRKFDPKTADRPHLFVTDCCGQFAHFGRTILAKEYITSGALDNIRVTLFTYDGAALLKYVRSDIVGMGVFHYWGANFVALNSI